MGRGERSSSNRAPNRRDTTAYAVKCTGTQTRYPECLRCEEISRTEQGTELWRVADRGRNSDVKSLGSAINHIWPQRDAESTPAAVLATSNHDRGALAVDENGGEHHDSNVGNRVAYDGVSGHVHPGVEASVEIGTDSDRTSALFDAPNGEPVAMTGSSRFRLEYDLKSVGPQGETRQRVGKNGEVIEI